VTHIYVNSITLAVRHWIFIDYTWAGQITNTQIKTNLRFTPTSYVVSDKMIPNYENNDWAVLSSRRGLHLMDTLAFLSTELDRFLQTRLHFKCQYKQQTNCISNQCWLMGCGISQYFAVCSIRFACFAAVFRRSADPSRCQSHANCHVNSSSFQ
jgi:hypothetical protein